MDIVEADVRKYSLPALRLPKSNAHLAHEERLHNDEVWGRQMLGALARRHLNAHSPGSNANLTVDAQRQIIGDSIRGVRLKWCLRCDQRLSNEILSMKMIQRLFAFAAILGLGWLTPPAQGQDDDAATIKSLKE